MAYIRKTFKVGDKVYIERGTYLPRIFGMITEIDSNHIATIQDRDNKNMTYHIMLSDEQGFIKLHHYTV